MKIRIKNIFVNKKKGKIKERVHKNENLNLKIVYDANCVEDVENLEEKKTEKNLNESTKRVRKGYATSFKENINIDKVENNNNNNKKFKVYYNNLVKNKNRLSRGYYILFFGMLVLGSLSVRFAYKTYKLYNKEEYEIYGKEENDNLGESVSAFSSSDEKDLNEDKNSDVSESENLQDVNTNNNDTKIEEKNTETKKSTSTKTIDTASSKKEEKINPLSFVRPVEGEVLKIFSNDKVIYSKTLELWKTHDGIDLKAEEGEYVKAVERGTIEKIYEDSFLGVTIVIDHGQGYKSSYSNLDNDTLVKEKQTVTKSQKIAKIGKTAIGEIKDESHLHFMLFKDNVSIDPTGILK